MWNAIAANPDTVLTIVTALLGLLGLGRWRQSVRNSTAGEVDRWASVAAGGVVLAIRSGLFATHEAALASFLAHFRKLAAAAGVNVTPDHEQRAIAIAQEQLVSAGQRALVDQAAKLKTTLDHFAASMAKLQETAHGTPDDQ